MRPTASALPDADPAAPQGDRLATWLFAVGATLGYACLVYVFGAVLPWVRDETGWSAAALSLGPTLASLLAAACMPLAGRVVDAGRGPEMMTVGAVLGGLALALMGAAQGVLWWTLAWVLLGPAQSAGLYDATFAFLTRRLSPVEARRAIIRVTLMGGFASTIAFPLAAGVDHHGGWRAAVWVFAGLEALVAAPAFWLAGARLRRRETAGSQPAPAPAGTVKRALRRPAFWAMLAAFLLCWIDHQILISFLIPIFTGAGATARLAVAAAAVVGPFQVLGRLVLMMLGDRTSVGVAARLAVLGLVVASGLLLVAGVAPWMIFTFAMMQGASIGAMSILRPLLVAEVMGRKGFGAVYGAISVAPMLATGAAPVLGALLLSQGWAAPVLAAMTAGAVALALLMSLGRQRAG